MDDDYFAPFESSKLLIGQANARIRDFEVLCQSVVDPNGYEFVKEVDNKSREEVVSLRLRKPIAPAIRLAAYSIVNDLKHALDQAVCDGALHCGLQHPKGGIYFPVGKTVHDLKCEIKRRCRNVHPDLVAFIEALNVCEVGNPRLYAVLALAGPNKHQRIISVRPRNEVTVKNWDPTQVSGRVTIKAGGWIASKNQIELLRIGEGGYFKQDLYITLGVSLGKGEPPLDGLAEPILRETASEVERIVRGLEAESARILAEHS